MYSVLIQNQKTMESFQEFRPIFMNALNDGQIDACLWAENGTTIDTAVPELYDMIQDKEEWRAIIIRMEDGPCMKAFDTAPDNPYDFLVSQQEHDNVQESDVPLIRLTHMLAGVPAPPVQFIPRMEKEEGKEPRIIYEPKQDEEDKSKYVQLSKKYRLHGPRPSEILLITLRKKGEVRDDTVEKSWQNNNETDSSEFWQRNNYPSICRFVCIDAEDKGEIQRTADLFSMWTAVMLLATNPIDPSTLQAYTLHCVSATFDREAFQNTLQEAVSRSLGAQHFIQKGLQRELEQEVTEDVILPDYGMQVPVVMKLPTHKDVSTNPGAFHLTSKTTTSDAETWRDMKQRAEKEMETVAIAENRALEQSTNAMRYHWTFRGDEVYPLSKYQAEDMTTQLNDLRRRVYGARTELPENMGIERKTLTQLTQTIKGYIRERLTRRQAWLCYALVAIGMFLSFLPSVLTRSTGGGQGSWVPLLLGEIFALVAFAIVELITLLVQQFRLRGALRLFNHFASGIVTRTADSAAAYSRYMGDVASCMRGNSFLTWVERKNFFRDEAQYYKRNHLLALGAFLAKLKEWSTAFHLTVNFDRGEMGEDFVMDTNLSPKVNPLYTFEDRCTYSVPVNKTGDTVESPFGFVQRLNIKREELYDDVDQ